MLHFNLVTENKYDIFFNDKKLGSLIRIEDGYFYLDLSELDGLLADWVLKDILDKLQELNKEWNDHINTTLNPNIVWVDPAEGDENDLDYLDDYFPDYFID